MADDLDDALFSLAAGRTKPYSRKRSRKGSDSDEDGAVESDGDSEEAPRRKKSSRGSASKRGKKPQSDDEDIIDDDHFDDEEGPYENEEDRRKLMAMTELEREMILADRAEMRDKERQRRQLLQQQRTASEKVRPPLATRAGLPERPTFLLGPCCILLQADKGRRKQDAWRAKDGKGTPRNKASHGSFPARSTRDWSDVETGKSSGDEEEVGACAYPSVGPSFPGCYHVAFTFGCSVAH